MATFEAAKIGSQGGQFTGKGGGGKSPPKGSAAVEQAASARPQANAVAPKHEEPSGMFDSEKTNREIQVFKRAHPTAVPRMMTLTDKMKKAYQDKYDFYIAQRSTDAERIRSIEANLPMAPVIASGEDRDWWLTDGDHRMAVAAHMGMDKVPAYTDFSEPGGGVR